MNVDSIPGLDHWHDFFLMTGTAAVTLVGLLFVALSFNLDVVLHESKTHLLGLARQTFLGFLYVLFISLLFLIPGVPPRMLGAQILVFAVFITIHALRGGINVIRRRDFTRLGRFMLFRNISSVVSGIFMVTAARALLKRDTRDLAFLVSGLLMIFGVSSGSAWTMLVEVGKMKAELWPDRGKTS